MKEEKFWVDRGVLKNQAVVAVSQPDRSSAKQEKEKLVLCVFELTSYFVILPCVAFA